MPHSHKLKLSVLLIAATYSSLSFGAGYGIIEQSVTGLGRAFAGSAAVAEDSSTIFFNPAGLTNLKHAEIAAGMNYIRPNSEFKDNGSALPNFGGLGGFSGQPLTGGDGGDAGKNAFVPNLYYSQPINDTMVAGIGINAPFGLVTEYDDDWQGRYHAVKSDLKTININPTFAYKASDKLSVGVGIDLQYIDLELTQMADLGARAGFPQGAGLPFATDGKVKITADDWSWGYNLGLTYNFQEATRLGIAYRSKISHELKGTAKLRNATDTTLADENVSGKVTMPETLSFALHHQLNNKWAIMGDATWTRWSRFQELVIESDGILNSSKEENWGNTMRYGLGLTYAHNEKWTFRSGIAYDETPIPDPQHRTARIPGNDRKWLSFGASYKATENLVIDAGYSHLFISDTKIDETDDNGYNLNGTYESDVDLLGVQARWYFI